MKRVALVTVHVAGSKRKAGFHWLAEAFREAGWHVTFVTVSFSQLSRLKGDHRFQYGMPRRANRLERLDQDLDSYVWFTSYHPLNRLPRVLQALSTPVFSTYGRLPMPGLRGSIAKADLVVFESSAGLTLVPRFRRWNPSARFAYRVSDDLRALRAHRVTLRAERQWLHEFEIVSVPTQSMLAPFASHRRAVVRSHGLNRSLFDASSPSPYGTGGIHAVFVGAAYLDAEFLRIAASAAPDWTFHVVGPFSDPPSSPNVVMHGELPFLETVAYIRNADIGLACLKNVPGAESFADSLKILQYTYARLPIVAPEFMRSERSNVVTYRPGDPASISHALRAAGAMDRSSIDRSGIGSWEDVARELAGPELWP